MRLGIIDLGTNSVRFDVYELHPQKPPRRLHREKIMIRLGESVFTKGTLAPDAIRRAVHAFSRFAHVAATARVSRIVAYGTSALREAADSQRLIDAIASRTGIRLQVLPGSEEARLIALGVFANEPPKNLPKGKGPKGLYALVDIGGGSTEVSICRGRKVLYTASLALGTARIQQLFLPRPRPSRTRLNEARAFIRQAVAQAAVSQAWPRVDSIVGSSGTIRTLARVLGLRSKNRRMTLGELSELVEEMSRLSPAELAAIPGMEPKRVDMILAGALVLDELMQTLGARKGVATEYALRDGVLTEEERLFREGGTSTLSLHLDDVLAKAVRLGGSAAHLRRLREFTEALFDRLAPLHRLESTWKNPLVAAALLKDTGKSVHIEGHWRHSYYIARHADLPGMEEREKELIAQLCLRCEAGKPEYPEQLKAFPKLLALLRVIHALDPVSQLRSLRIDRKTVTLRLDRRRATGLETVNLQARASLFEKVFRRSIRVRA